MPRAPRQTDQELIDAVDVSTTFKQVCDRLGLWAGGGTYLRITEWNGAPIPLKLDHIDGDNTDNRLENLRILCPNCHAVTETWCKSRRRPA